MIPAIQNQLSKIVYLLNLNAPNVDEIREIESLIAILTLPFHWSLFLELIRLNCCESLVYINILKLKIIIPEQVKSTLHLQYEKIKEENIQRLSEAKEIFSHFHKQSIAFVIIKGQYLMSSLYHDVYYKKMNDVDFLVRKSDLDKISIIYKNLDLICAASLGGNNFRKQEQYSHHWPPFFTKSLNCVLGTHWNIIHPLSKIKIPESELWNHVIPAEYLNIPALAFDHTYTFFHLLLHLSYYKTGMKELADPINFFKKYEDCINIQSIQEITFKYNAFDPIYRNLCLINHFLNHHELSRLINTFKPHTSSFVVADTHFRCRESYYILRSRSTQSSKIEKYFAIFSLCETPFEKAFFLIKMWQGFLFPSAFEIKKMQSLADNCSLFTLFLAYVKNPFLLSRLFAYDLGWKIHVLLMIKHHLDVIVSSFRWIANVLTFNNYSKKQRSFKVLIKELNLPDNSILQFQNKLE